MAVPCSQVDVFSEPAMSNALSICHNIQVGAGVGGKVKIVLLILRTSCFSGAINGKLKEGRRSQRRRRKRRKSV